MGTLIAWVRAGFWAWLIPALTLLGLAVVWTLVPSEQYQSRVVGALAVILLGALAWLGWAVVCSRLPWWARLGLLVCVVALVAVVRVEGVDADFRPRFAWRWQPQPDQAPTGPATVQVAIAAPVALACPRFLGVDGRARVPAGWRLATDWAADPPRERWRRPVGASWSGCAVVGDRLWTMEQRGPDEVVVCYALADGAEIWASGWPASYGSSGQRTVAGIGPRTTPTVVGDQLLAAGATGVVACLQAADGRLRWQRDVVGDYQGEVLQWGMSGSPLVWRDLVVVTGAAADGGNLIALDLADGSERWRATVDRSSYASPVLWTLGGVEQLVQVHETVVSGHDPATGTVLWQVPWPKRAPKVAWPVPLAADRLFMSAGYGSPCGVIALRPDPWAATVAWQEPGFRAKFSQFHCIDGLVYGLDDGRMSCYDPVDRRIRWAQAERIGHGHCWLVGEHLLVSGEGTGAMHVFAVDPDHCRELARLPVVDDQFFNPPALAPPYLLLRDIDELVCWSLPWAATPGSPPTVPDPEG